jgi:hypothetical protein
LKDTQINFFDPAKQKLPYLRIPKRRTHLELHYHRSREEGTSLGNFEHVCLMRPRAQKNRAKNVWSWLFKVPKNPFFSSLKQQPFVSKLATVVLQKHEFKEIPFLHFPHKTPPKTQGWPFGSIDAHTRQLRKTIHLSNL